MEHPAEECRKQPQEVSGKDLIALTTCLIRSRLSSCTEGMKIRPLFLEEDSAPDLSPSALPWRWRLLKNFLMGGKPVGPHWVTEQEKYMGTLVAATKIWTERH